MKHFTKIVCCIFTLATLMLSGCASKPRLPLTASNITNPVKAYGWDLSGKILVKTTDDKLSSHLYWLHTPTLDEMRLTSMLGTSLLFMSVKPTLTTLEVNGKSYTDTHAEHLLTALTGWSIPVKQLPLWITGQFPYETIIAKDSLGRPSHIVTNEIQPWHINIINWQTDNPLIPKLLLLKKDALSLKIQINHWQALAPINQKPITRNKDNASNDFSSLAGTGQA